MVCLLCFGEGGRAPPPPPICASKWMLMFLILHTVCLYCFYLGTQRSRARSLGCSVSVLASPATLLVFSLSRLNRLPKFINPAPAAPTCLRSGSHISNWLLRCDGAADEVLMSSCRWCPYFHPQQPWAAPGRPDATPVLTIQSKGLDITCDIINFFLDVLTLNELRLEVLPPQAPQKRNSCFTRAHLPVIYFLLRS